jgi:hypothetical protein
MDYPPIAIKKTVLKSPLPGEIINTLIVFQRC